jgi:hypothetical protein
MAINEITANTLVDANTLNSIIRGINTVEGSLSTAQSAIYNASSGEQVMSNTGAWAVVSKLIPVTDHSLEKLKVTTRKQTISFGKTFLAAPLVFATLQLDDQSLTLLSIPSNAIISRVALSDCDVHVIVNNTTEKVSSSFKYKISIFAVGLVTIS